METFNQTRSIECVYAAIPPGTQYQINNDVLPDIWSLPCKPNEMYVTHKKHIPIPNTNMIQVNILYTKSFKIIVKIQIKSNFLKAVFLL